jgi:hypothetical protein
MAGVEQRPSDGPRDLNSLDRPRDELARTDPSAMTPEELLAAATAAGLSVSAKADRLVVRGPRRAQALAEELLRHKEAILPLVPRAPPWDQAEADRLLARVRAALAHAEVEHRAGRMDEARRNAVRTWLEVCEGYVRDREAEARRGWNALALLRSAARYAAKTAGCGR